MSETPPFRETLKTVGTPTTPTLGKKKISGSVHVIKKPVFIVFFLNFELKHHNMEWITKKNSLIFDRKTGPKVL